MAIVSLPGTPGIRIGQRGPTVMCCFLGWPSAASLRAVADAQLKASKEFGLVTVLSIIPAFDVAMLKQQGHPGIQLDETERGSSLKESAATREQVSSITLASALVVLPKGLLAAMIRSFIAAMSLVVKSQTPMQTFKEVAPGIEWLAAQPKAAISPGLLQDVEEWLQQVVPSGTGGKSQSGAA